MKSAEAFFEFKPIRNSDIVANFYSQPNNSEGYSVLVLGGSEGGIPNKLAKPIAKAGFPTLALAYFKEKNLPPELENIPLEYVNKAVSWLLNNNKSNNREVIVVGWSKGAELALLAASKDPRIKHVIAIAPSSVAWAGILNDWKKTPGSSWMENGKALTHVPFKPSGKINGLLDLYSQSLDNRTDAGKADIPVENIVGDVLLMTGSKDDIWPSERMANDICKKLNSHRAESCKHRNYPELGHLLDYKFLEPSQSMNVEFIKYLRKLN